MVMSSNGYQVPDLASILNTLSNYGASSTAAPTQHYDDNNNNNQANIQQPAEGPLDRRDQPQASIPTSRPVVQVDATTIIEWPAALRHVTKLAALDQDLASKIQKMMANQRENEQQWWAGREALIQKQASRVENRKKLDEVLRTVGGNVSSGIEVNDDAAELRNYDLKVHRAATTMVKAMTVELKEIGIPFFGTQPSLISESEPQTKNGGEAAFNDSGDGGRPRRISKAQHLKSQQRMIQHLEDLYKD